jgi:hypothetical protein
LTVEGTTSKETGSISCEVEFCIFYRLSLRTLRTKDVQIYFEYFLTHVLLIKQWYHIEEYIELYALVFQPFLLHFVPNCTVTIVTTKASPKLFSPEIN